jgi:hypothetical protein
MVFEVDESVGMLQDNVLDVTELGKFVPEIRFISSSTQLSYVDLSETVWVLVSLVMSIATSASASAV